jgi:hypothetical protein
MNADIDSMWLVMSYPALPSLRSVFKICEEDQLSNDQRDPPPEKHSVTCTDDTLRNGPFCPSIEQAMVIPDVWHNALCLPACLMRPQQQSFYCLQKPPDGHTKKRAFGIRSEVVHTCHSRASDQDKTHDHVHFESSHDQGIVNVHGLLE